MKGAIITIIAAVVIVVGVYLYTQRQEVVDNVPQVQETIPPLTEGDSAKDIQEDLDNLKLDDSDPDLSHIEDQL